MFDDACRPAPSEVMTGSIGKAAGRLPQRRWRRWTGLCCLFVGCALELIAVLGHFTPLGYYKSVPPAGYDRLDLGLTERTKSLDALYAEADRQAGSALHQLPPAEQMFILYDLVARRFTGGNAQHSIWSNWVQWTARQALGNRYPAVGMMFNPDNVLKYGHSGFCAAQSFVLVRLAKQAGIRARHVGLASHVVMEAWYDNDWHMYDPYLEVIGGPDPQHVHSVELLMDNLDRPLSLYKDRLQPELIRRIFGRRDLVNFISEPPWSYFHWSGQTLLYAGFAARYLKFLIPLFLMLLGLRFTRQSRIALATPASSAADDAIRN